MVSYLLFVCEIQYLTISKIFIKDPKIPGMAQYSKSDIYRSNLLRTKNLPEIFSLLNPSTYETYRWKNYQQNQSILYSWKWFSLSFQEAYIETTRRSKDIINRFFKILADFAYLCTPKIHFIGPSIYIFAQLFKSA